MAKYVISLYHDIDDGMGCYCHGVGVEASSAISLAKLAAKVISEKNRTMPWLATKISIFPSEAEVLQSEENRD